MGDKYQDSGLQTPQPDQPMPKETERRDDLAEDSQPVHVEIDRDQGGPDVTVDVSAAPSVGEDMINSD